MKDEAEPEKSRKPPSIAIRKVFVVGKVFAWVCKNLIFLKKFPDTQETFWKLWKVSG